ncbi:hypothetical protein NHQ30_002766 [Ciborinia camelliae]|nr:hypothetical protein NHQ30_002766 [Ciborinia camelliae]
MPQSLSSSMQGYYGSEKVIKEVKPHVPASVNKQPRVPYSPSYNLSRFSYVNGEPPLAFREPIPITERINGAKNVVKDFDAKMNKG